MANVITPMETNLAASGKELKLESTIEFNLGAPADRTPIITLLKEGLAFDQMIPFQVDIEAAQTDYNLWEAPSENLRARAVIVTCLYGAGGLKINPDGTPIPVPLAEGGWFLYVNPDGVGIPTSGPGINKITVDTENEARFQGYVFV